MKQTQNTLLPPAGAVPAKRSGAAQLALNINEKIINILEARAIQKRRNIESDKLEREIYDDTLERKSKPVVQANKANAAFKTNKPAIQMQGNNLPGTRKRVQQRAQQQVLRPVRSPGFKNSVENIVILPNARQLNLKLLKREF